ncbi:MAG: hypothetical protein JGK21_23640 [Microcoleus sp. PH2017_22_RUC_O_B]|nr:hypothetical protein [Microcoleus sp. PH2017_21_RUC_O_A]MCC3543288.1 hypothetical protein [Microcoleus sp. PH2017_22_RUC_O_B]
MMKIWAIDLQKQMRAKADKPHLWKPDIAQFVSVLLDIDKIVGAEVEVGGTLNDRNQFQTAFIQEDGCTRRQTYW